MPRTVEVPLPVDGFVLRVSADTRTRVINCLDCGGDLTVSPLLVGETATCTRCRSTWTFTRRAT